MNLTASAALQARSVYALVLRRIRSEYAGSRAGYAWAVVEPIVWVFVLKFAIKHGSTATVPPLGTSYEVFFATGIVLARTWRTSANVVSGILMRERKEKIPTLHRLDTAYAIWLLEMFTNAFALVIILAILHIFGFYAIPANPIVCILAFAGCAFFALGFALAFALLMVLAPGLGHFRGIFLMIVFFTSGFSFVTDRMPASVRNIVVWNPLLHVLEWFREGFYAGYECRSLDLVYLFGVTIVLMVIGLAGERAFRRRAGGQPATEDMGDV